MRALVVCPGRGSYDRSCLGQLQDRSAAARAVIDACDTWRSAQGTPTVSELDADERYRMGRHVAGEHASLLTFACSMADLADLSDEYEVVGVVGNSMGWYTTLAAGGALPLADAIRLVDTMGSYQGGNVIGGQVLYPLTDADWQRDAALRDRVEQALATTGAAWSIDLGGFAVLASDDVKPLLAALPEETRGDRTFPIQLPMHSAFHTPWMQASAARGQREIAPLLHWQAPQVPLIDGHLNVVRPRWADPVALAAYTLGAQVTEPFDFAGAVRTALHHCAPDVVVTLGPGNALGGNVARVLVWDHWRGLTGRDDFLARQASDAPVMLSFGVPEQRERLL